MANSMPRHTGKIAMKRFKGYSADSRFEVCMIAASVTGHYRENHA
jgi:hypothetical protein